MSSQTTTDPFLPASTTINTSSPAQSERPVTLPHIPELYNPLEQALDALVPRVSLPTTVPATEAQTGPTGAAFMGALQAFANRTTTWNNAPAYKSTLSPTLDAFTSISQATDPKDLEKLLADSWAADPAVTLRIIWNLRSIHEGKSSREQFYRAYAWLYIHHPRTAIANLRYLVEPLIKRTIKRKVPRVDDEEEDVVMVTVDGENPEDAKPQEEIQVGMSHGYWKDLLNILLLATLDQLQPTSKLSALHVYTRKTGEQYHEDNDDPLARDMKISAKAKLVRLYKHREWNKKVAQKLAQDNKYRALYITVARLFADGLIRDIKILQEIADPNTPPHRRSELSFDLTLVAKWAPSVGGCHDRVTSIATPIAELVYASGHFQPVIPIAQPLTQESAHYLRSVYTRWVTSPLRRFLQLPEIHMSAGQWNKIQYKRVASHCMRINKKHFIKHDSDRFTAYLRAVAEGKASVSGATLLPHELLLEGMSQMRKGSDIEALVIQVQWNSLLERVRESGTLSNAIAICDVSGSMGYLGDHVRKGGPVDPIFPAVALSMILAQVARPPWANTFITFSANPELVTITPEAGLIETAKAMVATRWGNNTDFNAVFTKLILPLAIQHKLRQEDMIQRLFVFSDMQFDDSRRRGERWATEHERMKAQFAKAGYVMPEIVYWNLAGAVAQPVTKDEEGVALVSGFSPGMMKVFLENGEVDAEEVKTEDVKSEEMKDVVEVVQKKRLDPIDTMMKALGAESFAVLEVLD